MNLTRVFTVAQREWREILRDRIYFLLAFLLPVMLMLVFGYGMSQDIEEIHQPSDGNCRMKFHPKLATRKSRHLGVP